MAINNTKIGVDITVDSSNIKSVYKGINQVQGQAENLIAEYQKLESEISRINQVISKGGNTEENIQKLQALKLSFDGVYQSLTATTQQLTTLISTFKTLGGAEKILAETSLKPEAIKRQNERSAEIRNKHITFAQNRGEIGRNTGIYIANQVDYGKSNKSIQALFPPKVLKDAKEFYTLLEKIEERRKNLGKYISLTDDEARRLPKDSARRKTHEAISQLKSNGKELDSYDIQDIFEQFSLAPLIKRAQAQIKDASFLQEGKGRLGIGGYNPFVSGQEFVPSGYKRDGKFIPNTSLKIYHPDLTQFELSGKSITQIESAYNELIEKGDKESLKHAKVIQDAILQAYKNTDSEFIKSKLEKRLYSRTYEPGHKPEENDYTYNSTFYSNLRPYFPKFSDPNYKKDFQIYDGLEYEHVDNETKELQKIKDELKMIYQEREATGEAVAIFKDISEYFSDKEGNVNPEFEKYVKEILETQSQDKNGVKNFKELISLILSNLKNSIYSEEGILPLIEDEVKKEKIVKGTGKTASDIADEKTEGLDVKTETILNKEKNEELKRQAITLYDGAVVKLFDTLTQIGNELDSTQQEILQPTLDMLSNIVAHTKKIDSKTLVNALSNYATFGSVITESVNSFADQTDTDRIVAMTEAVNFMPVETEQKMLDSLNFNGQFQKTFSIPLSNARDFINKYNLISSADKQVSNLATRIQSWNVDDFINDGLSELVSFVNNLPDIKDKDNTLMEALINNLRIVLAKKFFEIDNGDKKLRDLIEQVQELTIQGENLDNLESTDALDRFEFFIRQFYGETYNKGAYSINYNEEEAQKAKRSKTTRPVYPGSKTWEERSPKERFLGSTKALDVTARYGAGSVDEALEIIPFRIQDLETKQVEEEQERQNLLKIVLEYEAKLAEQTKIINQIAGKYYSKSSKSAIGGWKIDWKKSRKDFTDIPQKEITEDQEKFKKAQKELSKLKNSQEEDEYLEAGRRLKTIGKDSRSKESFDKAIAIIKADAEYLKQLKAYQEEEKQPQQSQQTSQTQQQIQENIQESQQLEQEIIQVQEEVNQSKEEIKQKLLSYAERYAKATSNIEKSQITREISSTFGKDSDEVLYWKNKKNRNELVREFSSLNSNEITKSQQQEQQALEETGKIAGGEHTKGIESATEAEKNKIVVSKELADVLSKEADAHEEVTKASEEEVKAQNKLDNSNGIRWDGKLDSIEGFIPEYDDKTHTYRKKMADGTYESVITATQGRDALYRGINPTFSEDLARLKKLAENATANNPVTAEMAGMNDKDFNFMTQGVIASGLRGDLFHHLVDIMSNYNDAVQSLEDLEKLAKQGDKQAQEDLRVYNDLKEDTISQLSRYGLGEDYLGINNRLTSYMDAYNKAKDRYGISRTKFSEKQLGLTLKGSRGNINIGVTPDQVYSIIDEATTGRNGAIFDSKTGSIKGYEALQLTTQLMALIANLDNVIETVNGKDFTVRDLIGDADLDKVKLFIADIGENYTEFIEYMRLTDEEVYNAFMNAKEVIENGAKPLTHEESRYRLNRQLQGSRIVGSSGLEDTINAETDFYQGKRYDNPAISKYINIYKQIEKTKQNLVELQEKLNVASADEISNLEEKIRANQILLATLEEILPELEAQKSIEDFVDDNGNKIQKTNYSAVRIGRTVLTEQGEKDFSEAMFKAQGELGRRDSYITTRISKAQEKTQLDLINQYINSQKELNRLKKEEAEISDKLSKLGNRTESNKDLYDTLTRQKELNKRAQENERNKSANAIDNGLNITSFTYTDADKNEYSLSIKNKQKLADGLLEIERQRIANERALRQQGIKTQESDEKTQQARYLQLLKQRHNAVLEYTKLSGKQEILGDKIQNKTATAKEQEEFKTNVQLMAEYESQVNEVNDEFVELEEHLRNIDALNINAISAENNKFKTDLLKAQGDNRANLANYQQSVVDKESKVQTQQADQYIKTYLNNLKKRLEYEREIEKQKVRLNNVMDGEKSGVRDYINLLNRQKVQLEAMSPKYEEQLDTINGIKMSEQQLANIEQGRTKILNDHELKLSKQLASFKQQIPLIDQLFGSIKTSFQNVSLYNITQRMFNNIDNAVRQVIGSVKELDSALVDIQIASGMSREETHKFMKSLNELGNELGMTTQEMASASNDWLRSGYISQEAVELTRASAMLAQLGMLNVSDATSYLISTLKGWKLEASEVMDVVSKLTAVDISAALSAGDLAESLSRVNNSANLSGISMNRMIALLTVTQDISQASAERVGTAWNSLIARINNVRAGKFAASQEEMESDTYNEDEWANLNDVETVLDSVGIKIRANYNTFKDTEVIIDSIAEKWKTWDNVTKSAVATAVAG